MKTKRKRLFKFFGGAILSVFTAASLSTTAMATNSDYLSNWAVGVAVVLDNDKAQTNATTANPQEVVEDSDGGESDSQQSTLVMSKVKEALNIREEAKSDSKLVGLLYKDCGGVILESVEGWTKIQSGDLIGWANNDYLYFGDEAQSVAAEVGKLVATNNTDALRVRKSPTKDAGVYGLLVLGEQVDAYETDDSNWISIEYDGNMGYVAAEFVTLEYHIDYGETIEAINAREAAEAAVKAKVQGTVEGIPEGTTDLQLLAALIQCEAGGESYEGKVAVGAVVMNRVASSGYPDTIQGVVFASGQFTPAMSGKVNRVLEKGGANASCLQAAQEAINGTSNVGGATRFRRVGNHDGQIIGNHVFW